VNRRALLADIQSPPLCYGGLRRRVSTVKRHWFFVLRTVLFAGVMIQSARAEELVVPAFTAYTEPRLDEPHLSRRSGEFTGWNNSSDKIVWFGELKNAGNLSISVRAKLPVGASSKLRLSAVGQQHDAEIQGSGTNVVVADFGTFEIKEPGYQRFTLESLNGKPPFGDIGALVLNGSAVKDAHFNLKPRRNAASVHLIYPEPKDVNIAGFYCEVTAVTDPIYTYYMACGWHRGYFGMQVNSPTERRIIFSVWDSGKEAISRSKVAEDNRVKLLGKGEGVYAGDFGNEGTGGHSHLIYNWKTGEKQRFYVTAQPDNGATIYSGYYFRPDLQKWMLISSWRAPKDGAWLHGLYSFSEDFVGSNGQLQRKALYGNQWVKTNEGKWLELTAAKFSHDPTGKSDRLDRFMGVEDGQFFLSQGGFIPGFTKYGELSSRPATGKPPVIDLPNAQ
jgi:hypothetical protein